MADQQKIEKAYLQEISWDKNGKVKTEGEKFQVQFNPQSLKVNYANQKTNSDQKGGSSMQFVGQGTTKMSVELLFDATVPHSDGTIQEDVRYFTQEIARYIKPTEVKDKSKSKEKKFLPPGVRFQWGTFLFEGVVDSINETLEFFSETGYPLRATVSMDVSSQEIFIRPVEKGGAGSTPLSENKAGDTLQDKAGPEWQGVAEANGIEDPRNLEPGGLLDLEAGAGLSAGLSAGASVGFGAGISASAGFGGGIGGGISGGIGGGISGGISGGIGGGIGGGISGGIGGGISGGISGGIGGSVSGGLNVGTSSNMSIGAAVQSGFGASTHATGGIGGGIGGGISGGVSGSASGGVGGSVSGGISGQASGGITSTAIK